MLDILGLAPIPRAEWLWNSFHCRGTKMPPRKHPKQRISHEHRTSCWQQHSKFLLHFSWDFDRFAAGVNLQKTWTQNESAKRWTTSEPPIQHSNNPSNVGFLMPSLWHTCATAHGFKLLQVCQKCAMQTANVEHWTNCDGKSNSVFPQPEKHFLEKKLFCFCAANHPMRRLFSSRRILVELYTANQRWTITYVN